MTKITSTHCSGGAMYTMPTLLQRGRLRIDGRIRRVFFLIFFFHYFTSFFIIVVFLLVVLFSFLFVFLIFNNFAEELTLAA